jgi:hypothetical protein
MTTYLCDYENVQDLTLIKEICNGDKLVIIFTGAAGIKLRQLDHLKKIGVEVEFIEVTPGNNALDFQLDLFLGYLIGKGTESRYVIISYDSGFAYAADFAAKLGASVTLLPSKKPNQQYQKKDQSKVKIDSPEKVSPQSEIKKKDVKIVKSIRAFNNKLNHKLLKNADAD